MHARAKVDIMINIVKLVAILTTSTHLNKTRSKPCESSDIGRISDVGGTSDKEGYFY
jgi:hypothetical protein